MSQLFPGKEVRIDARCVASGDPIRIVMRDSEVVEVSPEATVVHANVPLESWGQPNWAFT